MSDADRADDPEIVRLISLMGVRRRCWLVALLIAVGEWNEAMRELESIAARYKNPTRNQDEWS